MLDRSVRSTARSSARERFRARHCLLAARAVDDDVPATVYDVGRGENGAVGPREDARALHVTALVVEVVARPQGGFLGRR